ncbi:4-alpha-glucanotransferase [Brevibacillus sp. LEMMJ03]|nr:4-alpha-glucanotransferase [Brevibacillus agri]TRY23705.1 4-alpha-glucanotransferase [Brevibacillus sp. LEMMJ03]
MFAPVLGGLWQHRDVVEDVFDIDDLLDAHEIMAVREENIRRAQEAARLQQEGGTLR